MTPPPPFDGTGTLTALAAELGEHIAGEARGTWVCDVFVGAFFATLFFFSRSPTC